MTLADIFFNSFGRLRSGWRFLIFLFACQIIAAVLGIVVWFIFSNPAFYIKDDFAAFLTVNNFVFSVVVISVGWLCGKFFENLPFRALGCGFSDNWLRHLIFGLAFGTFAILFAAFFAVAFGNASFTLNRLAAPSAIWLTLGLTLVVFIVGAWAEEAFFRGYALQTFARARLIWFGIILTSALFASGHLLNPSANVFSWINTFLAGIFFGVGYFKTRTLWFSFGAHLMWNWVQGAILGISVSGLKELTPAPIFHPAGAGGIIWINGGDYGIEAGFACTIALLAATILIWFAPFLKPTEEMLILTDQENPKIAIRSEF